MNSVYASCFHQEAPLCGSAGWRSEAAAALPSGPGQGLLPGGAEPEESLSGGAEVGGAAPALQALPGPNRTR